MLPGKVVGRLPFPKLGRSGSELLMPGKLGLVPPMFPGNVVTFPGSLLLMLGRLLPMLGRVVGPTATGGLTAGRLMFGRLLLGSVGRVTLPPPPSDGRLTEGKLLLGSDGRDTLGLLIAGR